MVEALGGRLTTKLVGSEQQSTGLPHPVREVSTNDNQRKMAERTRIGTRRRVHEKGANFTSTFKRPFSLYAVLLDCRGPYLYQAVFKDQSKKRTGGELTHTAHAIFVLSVSMYADPFA